jgi:drug/metabolite transporter (DMT)-like permease
MSILLVVLMYAMWSSVFPFGKLALEHSPPIFLTAFRMLLAGGLLCGYLALKKRGALKLTKWQFFSLAVLGFFSIYLTNILEFWGLQHLSAAKVCFIYSLSPFFAALFSYLHFKEKINKTKFIGFAIGFLGFIPVLTMQSGPDGFLSTFKGISYPELAIMGAALFSVYGWVILRLIVKDSTVSPLAANGVSMLIGGAMALIHSCFIETLVPTPLSPLHFGTCFKLVAIMTLISNIVCYNLYGYMLKKYTATFLSFMGLLSPVFASINSWILIGERPSWIIFCSTALLTAGLFIVYRAELRQGYIKSSSPQPAST